jgi:hypothetical protein
VPQILVVTDNRDESVGDVVYSERIALSDFESSHFSGQLAERVGWAVRDADKVEHRSELLARARAMPGGSA